MIYRVPDYDESNYLRACARACVSEAEVQLKLMRSAEYSMDLGSW